MRPPALLEAAAAYRYASDGADAGRAYRRLIGMFERNRRSLTARRDSMGKVTKPRNRKAQDATLINVDALKHRVKVLERRVKSLEQENTFWDRLDASQQSGEGKPSDRPAKRRR